MENLKNSSKSSPKTPYFAIGTLAALLSFSACQKNKETTNHAIKENLELVEKKEIEEPWEYQLYKLNLNSIVPIKGDILKARVKIDHSERLRALLGQEDLKFENLLPMILKESMMDHQALSGSNAKGYMQLMDIAVKDVIEHYQLSSLKLNKNDPVDNIVLGSLYRKMMLQRVEKELKKLKLEFSSSEKEGMMILIYNIGPTRVLNLLKKSQAQTFPDFIECLRKKLGITTAIVTKFDSVYKVNYDELLGGKTAANFKQKGDKKIVEGLRYLSLIKGIDTYLATPKNTILLQKIVCSAEISLFSQVLTMREQGVFNANASINAICKVILETNGYRETETPLGVKLFLIKEALEEYLP